MTEDMERVPEGIEIEIDKATQLAWDAQAYLKEFNQGKAENNPAKVERYKHLADMAFTDMWLMVEPKLQASALQQSKGDEHLAQDILQITCMRAYQGLLGFRSNAKVGTWLHQIMFNQFKTHYGHKEKEFNRLAKSLSDENIDLRLMADPMEQPEEQLMHLADREWIEALLNKLEPRKREVIRMRLQGLHFSEIADILGIPEKTARVRKHRAMKALGDIVTKYTHGHPDQMGEE